MAKRQSTLPIEKKEKERKKERDEDTWSKEKITNGKRSHQPTALRF